MRHLDYFGACRLFNELLENRYQMHGEQYPVRLADFCSDSQYKRAVKTLRNAHDYCTTAGFDIILPRE